MSSDAKRHLYDKLVNVLGFLVELVPIAIAAILFVVALLFAYQSIGERGSSYDRMEAIYQECIEADVFTQYECVIIATKGS